ncbi:siderophore-interacting protein [Actinomadura macrotermitis]|uniref:FAD-binding FR-type domain-containing protein n=1 Tax=Actinomadura macrotermitis TaxID=2585200 RepID=A0A7K0BN57_9ACTN|nr:siderophore-interacting protein [Actinomadura macrotermitis]MQY02618.1 hypothetical protein [Actinomadura macrotermitis]
MYVYLDLRVARTERVSPSMVRVTLTGDRVDEFASGGRDQRFKLFLPHPHQDAPVVPPITDDSWFAAWQAMDAAERAVMRTYTVRAQRPGELDVDFALHGDGGPASRWAASAVPGDRVGVLGPASAENEAIDFRPPPDATTYLLAADETALPAVAGILAWLPPGARALVWIEGARQDLATEADAEITWVVPGGTVPAVRAAALPPIDYAWIAGESGGVKALRRHLVNERGLDRRAVKFTGYWRRGSSEEDMLAEVVAGGTPHLDED